MTKRFMRGSASGRAQPAYLRPGSFKQGHEKRGGRKRGSWDRDPELIKLGWPPPIRIRSRKFRSRIALENFKRVMARRAIEQRSRSAYGPKADHLGASATGLNMAVFEQDKSASPQEPQGQG